MSSKYVQPKILAFFMLIKSEWLRQISRENKDLKKKSLNSRVKSRPSIIISLKSYYSSKICRVIREQKLQKRS